MDYKELRRILDVPSRYSFENYISITRQVDGKQRVILPPEAKKFYNGNCKVIMNLYDGTITITPLKRGV